MGTVFLAYASPPFKQCRNFTNSKTSGGNKRIQKEHTLKKVYSYFSAKPLWNSLKCFGYSYPVKTILKHTTRKCAWILYADYAALTLWLLKGNPDTFFLGIETLIPHSKSILRPYLWRSTTCALRAEAHGVPGDGAQNNNVQSSQRVLHGINAMGCPIGRCTKIITQGFSPSAFTVYHNGYVLSSCYAHIA